MQNGENLEIENPPSILVVDDEPRVRELLKTLLARQGYEVWMCGSGEEAKEVARQETFDMIVTDLKMPGIDGLHLIQQIKEEQPDIAAVMVTGYATVETAVEALRHGADDYVTKPFNVEELRKVVARTLNARRLTRRNEILLSQLDAISRKLRGNRQYRSQEPETVNGTSNDRFSKISNLNTKLSSFINSRQLYRAALDLLCPEVGVSAASIMILPEGQDHLVVKAVFGNTNSSLIGTKQPISTGVSGWVVRHSEPLLVNDIRQMPLFQHGRISQYTSPSFICVPLTCDSKTFGTLNLTEKQNNSVFSDQDLQFAMPVAAQIAASLRNCYRYDSLRQNALGAVQRLVQMLNSRVPFAEEHSQRTTDQAVQIGQQLDLKDDELDQLSLASSICDIGNAAVPDQLLAKRGHFTTSEREKVQRHPEYSDEILKSLGFLDGERAVARHHHERVDGSGYPDGLTGDDIPLLARIVAVADSFVAMTSHRPHRRSFGIEEAMKELRKHAGTQFDTRMVEALEAAMKAAKVEAEEK